MDRRGKQGEEYLDAPPGDPKSNPIHARNLRLRCRDLAESFMSVLGLPRYSGLWLRSGGGKRHGVERIASGTPRRRTADGSNGRMPDAEAESVTSASDVITRGRRSAETSERWSRRI